MIRLLLALAGLGISPLLQAQVWGDLEFGEHPIGFETVHRADEFRAAGPDDAESSRPLQVSVWYPARSMSTTASMALRDYVHLTANESIREPTDLTVSDRQAAEAGLGDFPLEEVPRDVLEKALDLKSRAVSGAPVATGKCPLLVIVP